MSGAGSVERAAGRAVGLLARPGAWIEALPDGWAVRLGGDRRRRPAMRLDERGFTLLVEAHGLVRRAGGGWRLARGGSTGADKPDGAGRPGVIDGVREIIEPDGRRARRAANLGESPVAWLARRRDSRGRPWLSPVEAAAGERLREDFERAGLHGRLTMNWDGAPRSRIARGPGGDPAARNRSARARLQAALNAMGPGLREVAERVCLAGSGLGVAERDLGLAKGAGKALLKLALQRAAAHYGIG